MTATQLQLRLPAGFRFHPTDEELVMHYLCRKCASQSIAVPIIADLDLYKYDPWNLPGNFFYLFFNFRKTFSFSVWFYINLICNL